MVASTLTLCLKIEQREKKCTVSLSWAGGQTNTDLKYPPLLNDKYETWQRHYYNFYKSKAFETSDRPSQDGFRARRIDLPDPVVEVDWHEQLKISEKLLLEEFHQWLREIELSNIGQQIIGRVQRSPVQPSTITLLITCNTQIAKLPWETWDVSTRLNLAASVQIGLMPFQVSCDVIPLRKRSRHKIRVLAIIGETSKLEASQPEALHFQQDESVWRKYSRWVQLETIQRNPNEEIHQFNTRLLNAISDSRGWDALFFAGHSDESSVVDGKIQVSPDNWIPLESLKPCLEQARQKGLQFALFNSCSGFHIAEGLIDMGFRQVLVMREKIQHQAALQFLDLFLTHLTQYRTVWEALYLTRQQLAALISYPSAYLLPALFSHPNATPFQLPKPTWKRALPNWWEAIACSFVLASCLWPPTQDKWFQLQSLLLDQRTWIQAIYRDVTRQVPDAPALPPVTLVQIDDESLQERGIRDAKLIDRSYLADIVNSLTAANAKIIGIDYELDTPDQDNLEDDRALSHAIQQAFEDQQVWFVLAVNEDDEGQLRDISPTIADPGVALAASHYSHSAYPELMYAGSKFPQNYPFGYLLALIHSNLVQKLLDDLPSDGDLLDRLMNAVNRQERVDWINSKAPSIQNLRLSEITEYTETLLHQPWFRPIIDFSVPPNQIYTHTSADQLFSNSRQEWQQNLRQEWQQNLDQRIVIIAPSYKDADDYSPLPPALRYWQSQGQRKISQPTLLTGGEIHAYATHHILMSHLVIPIPDLVMMGVAAIVGRLMILSVRSSNKQQQFIPYFVVANSLYGLTSLQLYVSASMLVPVILPSIVFWIYVTSGLRR